MGSETQSRVAATSRASAAKVAKNAKTGDRAKEGGRAKDGREKHAASKSGKRADGAGSKSSKKKQRAPGAKPGNGTRTTSAAASLATPIIRPGAATPAIPPPAPEGRLVPVKARPTRSEREFAEARAREIDDVCAAWAAIVAERMAADQQFAETFEQFRHRPRDLRALFLWDALHAAESHLALVNTVIARHLEGRRADPFAILGDLRAERRRLAVVYAVNAFLAVLNQMSPNKPKWLPMESIDQRMAVLALAHQTMEYALEAARLEAPPDLTEHILLAAQDESVWDSAARGRGAEDRTIAACAATAAFFRALGDHDLGSMETIVEAYQSRARARAL